MKKNLNFIVIAEIIKIKKSMPFSMDFNIGYFKFKTLIVEELLDS